MANRFQRYGLTLLLVLSIAGTGYLGAQKLTQNPCLTVKTWSLGKIDPRFEITEEIVKRYSTQAADTWNNAYEANELLQYQENDGDIQVTFVYDERQRTTIRNERLKQTIEVEKEELSDIKRTLDSLKDEYASLADVIDTRTKAYTKKLEEHNDEVSYWNSQGGAPTADYQKLQREEAALETERRSLNASINRFNQLAELIKNYGRDHNEVVETLNDKIGTLNETALRDFEEGTYDPNNRTITIYEYADTTALKRVLIHEFGHALGLGHVDDKNAIMYSFNQGDNLNLTQADREVLSATCRKKDADDIMGMLKTTRDGIFHLLVSSWPDIPAQLK